MSGRSPSRARRASGGGRFYVWGQGERYWSVTTIIGGGIPKDALKWWAAKSVAEFAYDEASNWLGMTRDRAVDYLKREPFRFTAGRADVGSAVHAVAEAYALKKPAPPMRTLEERAIVAAFLDFTKRARPTFVATEASVYSRAQKYAGTLDAIADFPLDALAELGPHPWTPTDGAGHVRLLIDYKTGGDVADGKGVYPEAALQLNAYAGADFIGLPDGTEGAMPAVDGAAVLQIGAQGWRFVPVRLGDDVRKAFLYAREVYRWCESTSKTVLGDPLEHVLDTNPLEA